MLLDLRKLKNNLILLSTMKIYYGRAIYNKKEIKEAIKLVYRQMTAYPPIINPIVGFNELSKIKKRVPGL